MAVMCFTNLLRKSDLVYRHDENVKIDHRADAYVFLLDQNTNSKIKGYMPRTNSEGFVFTKGMTVEEIAETIYDGKCNMDDT